MPTKNETNEVTETSETNYLTTFDAKVCEAQLRLLAGRIKPTVNKGIDGDTRKLKNYVLKIRALVMSGGNFTADMGVDKNGEPITQKADCGLAIGITSQFDDCVSFATKNGVCEVSTIIDRNGKRGRKPSEVMAADEFTI
jgi:hypothetical protein